jgi:ABC-type transport system involved in cytochrome bd biosynthesis fused ATPase/permease subunit
LKKFTIRYQVKEFLQYSVPEIQKEFDKKRKLDEIACDNQKKNNQIKKVKKAKHSNENVKLEKTNSSATVLKGIPRCDLTVEEGKLKWDEIPIDKPKELK